MPEPDVIRPGPVAAWQTRAWELIVPRLPRSVMRLLGRMLLRLPRGSRARRWCVAGICQIAWDMTARTRYDLVLPIWDEDCEWIWDAQIRGIGFEDIYRGHDGVRRSLGNWNEVWEDNGFTVHEILDGGNSLLMRMTGYGRGRESGARVHVDVFAVAHLDPLIVRFANLADYEDALKEAGFA